MCDFCAPCSIFIAQPRTFRLMPFDPPQVRNPHRVAREIRSCPRRLDAGPSSVDRGACDYIQRTFLPCDGAAQLLRSARQCWYLTLVIFIFSWSSCTAFNHRVTHCTRCAPGQCSASRYANVGKIRAYRPLFFSQAACCALFCLVSWLLLGTTAARA